MRCPQGVSLSWNRSEKTSFCKVLAERSTHWFLAWRPKALPLEFCHDLQVQQVQTPLLDGRITSCPANERLHFHRDHHRFPNKKQHEHHKESNSAPERTGSQGAERRKSLIGTPKFVDRQETARFPTQEMDVQGGLNEKVLPLFSRSFRRAD
jgi:hypothetical protein